MNTMTTNKLVSCDLNSSYNSITASGKFCSSIYDGKTCWPFAKADTNVSLPCPNEMGFNKMETVHKYCMENGKWDNRTNLFGTTDYSNCYTQELIKLLKTLGSNDNMKRKLDVATNTISIEIIGFLISIIALKITLVIFMSHKRLLEQIFKTHINLFVALSLQILVKLILDIDKLEPIINKNDNKKISCFVDCNNQPKIVEIGNNWVFRVIHMPLLCEVIQILKEWFKIASYSWMLIEALYLYGLIKARVVRSKPLNLLVYFIGWVLPLFIIFIWLITITKLQNFSSICSWDYSLIPNYWIVEGSVIIIFIVNFIILLIVLRELNKMQSNLTPFNLELDIIRKLSNAAIFLVPLHGITNLIFLIFPEPHSYSPELFALWAYTAHTLHSFQGFMMSIVYGFTNNKINTIFENQMMHQRIQRDFEIEMANLNPN